jgi:hypothetical protein
MDMEDSMVSEVPEAPSVLAPRKAVSLGRACTDVIAEYRSGRWPQIIAVPAPELRAFLLNELLARCPGFSTREYRIALTKRLVVRGSLPKERTRRRARAMHTGG